ncbi:hypothetical protein C8F01DRAFT_1083818 [Mycena amicta]|nr:hypothetical protein C8F01DRAFT_1083818 [Mycena amicta]
MSLRRPYVRIRSLDILERRAARNDEQRRKKAIAASIAHTKTLVVRYTLPSELYRVRHNSAVVASYLEEHRQDGAIPLLPVFPGGEKDTENLRICCLETAADVEALGPGGIDITWVKWLPDDVLAWLKTQPLNRVYAAHFVQQITLPAEQLL